MNHRLTALGAIAASGLLALAACGDDSKPAASSATAVAAPTTVATSATPSTSGAPVSIVVGSANFPEAVVLGQIYAGALEAKGIKVTRKLNIGARELYYKAITGGEIDLLPEYTNSLLSYVDKAKGIETKAKNVTEQLAALKTDLDPKLTVLTPSTAEDKDVLVCNSATASKFSLKTLSDLAKVSKDNIALGAQPEFSTRTPFGLVGLKTLYNMEFKSFTPLKGTPLVDALKSNAVQCANLFSTDSSITTNGFVSLDDDKVIVPNEAVLPLIVKDKATPAVTAALDAVDAKLTTDELKKLVTKIEVGKAAEGDVATKWLADNNLNK
ncbi:MAG: Substrate-binding region of ABC-type glycine betaine transport system [Acidimicrobiia bacterium]|nr:Substrate-binding region of ABC-type glycine betaine transport system [Acidimicrobiia bacterium]